MTNQTPKERLEGAIYKTSIYDVVNDHMEDVRDTTIAYMKWAEGRIGELEFLLADANKKRGQDKEAQF